VNFIQSKYFLPLAGMVALLGVSACELIAAVDRTKIGGGGGFGAAPVGGGGIGGTTEGGGGAGACDLAQCPSGTDCQTAICDASDECALENKPVDTPCSVNDEAGLCDDGGMCIALTCSNSVLDPGETAVDCGGPTCPKCDNDLDCVVDADCKSNNCGAGDTCEPCEAGMNCVSGTYCDTTLPPGDEVCADQKDQGSACTGVAGECTTGFCTDGFCCNTECDGPCRACDASGSEGTCSNHPDGESPETPGCAGDTCINDVLTTSACAAGLCEASSGDCPNGFACASATACGVAPCADESACQTDFYCDIPNCLAKKALGDGCSAGVECQSGNCVDGVCCSATQCSGACNACNVNGLGTCATVPDGQQGGCPATQACQTGACCVTLNGSCQNSTCCAGLDCVGAGPAAICVVP
jgi:hypothetical protein